MESGGVAHGRAQPIGVPERNALLAGQLGAGRLLIAVSGGADSMALLHLTAAWHADGGSITPSPLVATIDHGLRTASAGEAAWVDDRARELGLEHRTLLWTGSKPTSGLQAAARAARYRLLAEAARAGGCDTVLLAHTLEDQAETVLMRLARGSGIDGLAAMPPLGDITADATWAPPRALRLARPLLGIPKARLRATLVAARVPWLEDPSNTDPRFERVRLRAALAKPEALGLSAEHLALTAQRARRARTALEQWTDDLVRHHADILQGMAARVAWSTLISWPEEAALRVLDRLVWALGGQARPPSLSRLERAWQAMFLGARTSTLGGCILTRDGGDLVLFREMRRGLSHPHPIMPGEEVLWDRRFRLSIATGAPMMVNTTGALVIRALGNDGLRALCAVTPRSAHAAHAPTAASQSAPGKPGMQFASGPTELVLTPVPRSAWPALPSVWSEGRPVAVPHLSRLAPERVAQLPWQAHCDCRFEGESRLWKATLG